MQKRAGKAGTRTAQGDALRRVDGFNAGMQIAVVNGERNIQNLIRIVRGVQASRG